VCVCVCVVCIIASRSVICCPTALHIFGRCAHVQPLCLQPAHNPRYDNAVEAGGPDLKDHPLCVRCFNAHAVCVCVCLCVCVCVCVCFVSVRVRVWTGGIT
jgi:hypothetical protein